MELSTQIFKNLVHWYMINVSVALILFTMAFQFTVSTEKAIHTLSSFKILTSEDEQFTWMNVWHMSFDCWIASSRTQKTIE